MMELLGAAGMVLGGLAFVAVACLTLGVLSLGFWCGVNKVDAR